MAKSYESKDAVYKMLNEKISQKSIWDMEADENSETQVESHVFVDHNLTSKSQNLHDTRLELY